MALSYNEYVADGSTTNYTTPKYLQEDHLVVTVDGTPTTDYTLAGESLTFNTAPLTGSIVRIGRNSNQTARITDYVDGSLLTADVMDEDANQLFYMAQEAIDTASETNLAGSTFYNSSVSPPENPKLGDLWYDEHNKYLKVFNGTSWDLASPSNETAIFESDSFDNSEAGYTFISINGINIEASVYLNGVKLVRGIDKASLLSPTDAKDYYIDADNNRIYFKTLASTDIVQIILSLFAMGTAQRASEISVTATQGQTVFNLAIPYVPNSTSLHVYVNGVRQSAYTETDKDTVTFDNGLNAGDEVSFIINKYLNHTLLSAINQADVDNAIATIQATVDSEVIARASDTAAMTAAVTNHASSFNSSLASTNASITAEQTTRANADSALASDISTLQATVNGQSGSITSIASVQSDVEALKLKYGVTLNGNGHITGFSQNNDGTTGDFNIVADKFSVINPNTAAGNAMFQVVTSGANAGVYINDDRVKPSSVVTSKIANNAVTIPASTYSATQYTLPEDEWSNMATVTYTSTGTNVIITAGYLYLNNSGDDDHIHLQLLRNGTVVRDFGNLHTRKGGAKLAVCVNLQDTPSAGTVTYKLRGMCNENLNAVSHRYITILEVKK